MTFDEKLLHGEDLIQQDKYHEAFDVYCDLSYERPENKELLIKAQFLFNRMKEAYSDFEPQSANDFLFRGVARFYDRDIYGSHMDYDKAIELNPALDAAHYYKSINYREEGKNELAIKEVEKAIAKNPNCDYFDEVAENLFRLGRVQESRRTKPYYQRGESSCTKRLSKAFG